MDPSLLRMSMALPAVSGSDFDVAGSGSGSCYNTGGGTGAQDEMTGQHTTTIEPGLAGTLYAAIARISGECDRLRDVVNRCVPVAADVAGVAVSDTERYMSFALCFSPWISHLVTSANNDPQRPRTSTQSQRPPPITPSRSRTFASHTRRVTHLVHGHAASHAGGCCSFGPRVFGRFAVGASCECVGGNVQLGDEEGVVGCVGVWKGDGGDGVGLISWRGIGLGEYQVCWIATGDFVVLRLGVEQKMYKVDAIRNTWKLGRDF